MHLCSIRVSLGYFAHTTSSSYSSREEMNCFQFFFSCYNFTSAKFSLSPVIFTDFPPFLFIAVLFASQKEKKMKHLNTFLYSEQTHRSRRAHGNLCQGIFIYGWNVLLFIFIFPLRTIFFSSLLSTHNFFPC